MRLHRHLSAITTLVILGLSLSGCGGAEKGADDSTPVIIEITESSGEITPNDGHVVKVKVGQQVQLNVSSDVADEIHVHSEPEHEFEVPAGQDETFTFTVETPGTVPIESHGLEVTLVKLEVS
jgi:plastocyanin